jgi:hypothetical protein
VISEALLFLKDQLNVHVKSILGADGTRPDPVGFIDGEKMDPLTFPLGAVSILLINLEEETTLRADDPFKRSLANGTQQRVQPAIRLNLFVLCVAHYKQYPDALHALSLVVQYFQSHRLFTQANAPGLSESIERLVIELITLPFAEQNEVWSALRVAYHPSVVYKVKMVVFQDDNAVAVPEIDEQVLKTSS